MVCARLYVTSNEGLCATGIRLIFDNSEVKLGFNTFCSMRGNNVSLCYIIRSYDCGN